MCGVCGAALGSVAADAHQQLGSSIVESLPNDISQYCRCADTLYYSTTATATTATTAAVITCLLLLLLL